MFALLFLSDPASLPGPAGSGSRACGGILLHFLRSGAEVERFVRSYDMTAIRTAESRGRYSYGR